MITLGLPITAEAVPAAALAADVAGGADAGEGADFGNLLRQFMGSTPGARQAIDLPLDGEEVSDASEQEDVDELVNAIVVDLGAPPVLRLAATTVWAVAEAPALPVAQAGAVAAPLTDSVVGDAAFGSLPVAAHAPSMPVEALARPEADIVDAVPLPASTGAADASDVTVAAASGSAASSAPAPSHTPSTSPPIAGAQIMTPDRPAAESAPVEPPAASTPAAPTPAAPAVAAGELLVAPAPSARAADQHEPARPNHRLTAEAGQRAYAAAESDAPGNDSRQGFSEARHEFVAELGPVSAAPAAPAAVPFHVVADRPAPPIAPLSSAPVVMAAATVDAAAAAELPTQVVQSIRLQAIDGGGEAIVRLRPDYLGELVVAVKVENGAVIAALQSDTPAVRKWVEANEATLRQALAEHGLQLDRLTISDEPPSTDTNEHDPQRRKDADDESEPQPRRQRQPAPDATFEVIV